MKILHISSMAGIAEILSRDRPNDIIFQVRDLDKFGFGDYYGKTHYFMDYEDLITTANRIQDDFDKIIIHDFIEFLPEFPEHKVVIYFHGSKLRVIQEDQKDELKDYRVILTNKELLEYYPEGMVVPQPIDLELFTEHKLNQRDIEYLSIQRGYQFEKLRDLTLTQYPKCKVLNRNENIEPYQRMPIILNSCKNYIDVKWDYSKPEPKPLPDPSCTGLQALACGCRVFSHNHKEFPKSLLKRHDSKIIVERFLNCLEDQKEVKSLEI